jgi:two-component system sensor histidine kinase BaeS
VTGSGLIRFAPRSLRARIVFTATAALLVGLAGFLGVRAVLDSRAHDQLESTLTTQADAVARAVVREGPAGAQRAARLLPDTRIVVKRAGLVEYWNLLVRDFDVTATGRAGDVEVTLQRDENPGVASWVAPLLIVIVIGVVVALAWLVAGGLARRLRRAATGLAGQAERVAEGDLSVRAEESDDEMGRIARSFNRMTEKLELADTRERAFLADVAHELRTPVTAIDGFAQALADGTARSEEDRAEAAEMIRQEAARLKELVGDLRRLTWLELDPPIERSPADIAEITRKVLQRSSARAEGQGVSLVVPTEPIVLETDPDQVETIVVNLVDNAIRHTPPGGIVSVTCQADDMGARIDVTDTGPGIAPEHLPFVFDRLYRAEAARERTSGEGSGLGLAIVKKAAERLGGQASVSSRPGDGATFSIHLPGPLVPEPTPATADQEVRV